MKVNVDKTFINTGYRPYIFQTAIQNIRIFRVWYVPSFSTYDFLNLIQLQPLCQGLKLEAQLYKGRLYRLHRGKALGEPVLVKVFRGESTRKVRNSYILSHFFSLMYLPDM